MADQDNSTAGEGKRDRIDILMESLEREIGISNSLVGAGLLAAYPKLAKVKFRDEDNPTDEEFSAFRSYLVNHYKKMREEMAMSILKLEQNGVSIQWERGDTTENLRTIYAKIEEWAVANGAPKQGGCYVATAVYGSYDCPPVWTLRRYRDSTLQETFWGRAFIRAYYAISPALVRIFSQRRWFTGMVRPLLDRFVTKLREKGYDDSPYCD